jgi:hypothetical protein
MTEKVLDMIKDFPVEVKIVIENRRAARIALRKKQIILRMPKANECPTKKQSHSRIIRMGEKYY